MMSKALVLTEKERKRLRALLYGVRIGGCMTADDYALAHDIERRLAPSKMPTVGVLNETPGKDPRDHGGDDDCG